MPKKKFDYEDDISKEDLALFLHHKGIASPDKPMNCTLCGGQHFSFTDSLPFFPSFSDESIKYRLALKPNLLKPTIAYIHELAEKRKNGEIAENIPLDLLLKTPDAMDAFDKLNSKELIVLICENCGHTIMLDRTKVVAFLASQETQNDE